MHKKIVILLGLVIFTFTLQAQVGMGKWRTHFAYNLADQIAQSENKIFAVSEGSLFSIDKRDGNMEFYNKISGLNGTVISRIEYDKVNKILLIIYNDGNIDFLSASGVKNLPDFYNKQMSANKAVNHILFHDNKAFLSANFGIIVLNMIKIEIQDTYYIGDNASEVKILNTTLHKGNIYAVSETEIYSASVSNPLLISYESWGKMMNLPGNDTIQALYSFGDYLVLLRDGKLYKQDANGVWSNVDATADYTGIVVSGDYLQAYSAGNTVVFDSQFTKSDITDLFQLKDGIYDSTASKFWFAGDPRGVILYDLKNSSIVGEPYLPAGPAVNTPFKLKFAGERLFVLQGGRWEQEYNRPGIVMIYENNKWKNIDNQHISSSAGRYIKDFMDIAVVPNDKTRFFVSSFGNGLVEFRNDQFFKWYHFNNSPIQSVFDGNWNYMRVDGLTLDDQNNLWVMDDMGVTNNIFKILNLEKDDDWFVLDHSMSAEKRSITNMLISNQNKNHKWFLAIRNNTGIVVLDDNGTLKDKNDDKLVVFKSFTIVDNDKVTMVAPKELYCMTQEKNGTIWVGSSEGPLVFNSANVFNPNFSPSRIKVPRNNGTNQADYLLDGIPVTAIAIDAANRKWLGTENNGVYHMSENGQTTIHHFTTLNSPLLSNKIFSIDIHPVTGEVFFGTGIGLVSYQSDAAEGSSTFINVHAYPNPVRENFTGVITITGLIDKTNVKITDVAGNLISETTSNGSIATWDGKNKFGQKVSTGVYLAICVTPDGSQSTTTKILVIN